MTVTITPLTPVFAGEVGAIDLRQVHDRQSLEAIRAGMDKYAVLVFRDPMWRASPTTSGPLTSYSPTCSPALISSPSVRTAARMAVAHRIAGAGAANVASMPSPVVTISFPRRVFSSMRTAA